MLVRVDGGAYRKESGGRIGEVGSKIEEEGRRGL